MSNPEDQRADGPGHESRTGQGPQQTSSGQQVPGVPPTLRPDRGYYGAGWNTPQVDPYGRPRQTDPYGRPLAPDPYGRQQPGAAQPGPYGAQPGTVGGDAAAPGTEQQWRRPRPGQQAAGAPGAGWAPPARQPRKPADPSAAFAPGVAPANVVSAAIAVLGVFALQIVIALAFLIGDSAIQSTIPDSSPGEPFGRFLDYGVAQGFPFMVGAFLVLVFLAPVMRRSPLPVVLLRAVLAGAGGTVALAVVGVFTAAVHAASETDSTYFVTDVVSTPLGVGIEFTAMLLGTAAVAWLWLGRPRSAPRPTPAAGRPGTMPPADAVPPATVQQRAQQSSQPPAAQVPPMPQQQGQPPAPQAQQQSQLPTQQPQQPPQHQQPQQPRPPQHAAPSQWAPPAPPAAPPARGDETDGR